MQNIYIIHLKNEMNLFQNADMRTIFNQEIWKNKHNEQKWINAGVEKCDVKEELKTRKR